MGRVWCFSILAVLTVVSTGCKTDQATKTAEQMDSRATEGTNERYSTPPAPNATVYPKATAAADSRPVLVCFGDSLTAGYGADPGQSYPDFLQTDLNRQGYKYRVMNEGISGDTTKDGLDRVDDVIQLKPAVVVVEFGGNDGLRGVPIADSRANLDAILARLTGAGIKVALAGMTLPPDYGPDYIKQFDETYVLLSKKYHAPMIPFLLKNVYGVPGLMQADNTHATDAGNKIVAANVFPLVAPFLKR